MYCVYVSLDAKLSGKLLYLSPFKRSWMRSRGMTLSKPGQVSQRSFHVTHGVMIHSTNSKPHSMINQPSEELKRENDLWRSCLARRACLINIGSSCTILTKTGGGRKPNLAAKKN